MGALVGTEGVHNVKELLLWDNCIGDKGVALLARGEWRNLGVLRLAENGITKDGVRKLIGGSFVGV